MKFYCSNDCKFRDGAYCAHPDASYYPVRYFMTCPKMRSCCKLTYNRTFHCAEPDNGLRNCAACKQDDDIQPREYRQRGK